MQLADRGEDEEILGISYGELTKAIEIPDKMILIIMTELFLQKMISFVVVERRVNFMKYTIERIVTNNIKEQVELLPCPFLWW